MVKKYKSVVVIFDSLFGNTQKIAEGIARAFKSTSKVKIKHVSEVKTKDIFKYDLVIVGSPTQGGRPTLTLLSFLQKLDKNALSGKDVASFDTRLDENNQRLLLRYLMKIIGYAAPKILKILNAKGGNPISKPQAFVVKDRQGPLLSGEVEKATATWLKLLRII